MVDLNETEIVVGKTYFAKKPKNMIFGTDDRTVKWMTKDRKWVEYDSDFAKPGKRYPIIKMSIFINWVGGVRQ